MQTRVAAEREPGTARRTHVPETATPVASHPLVRLQGLAGNGAVSRLVQRAGSGPEEEELQMKRDGSAEGAVIGPEGGTLAAPMARQIDSLRGQGSGLSASIRQRMEPALGVDLGGVSVHKDQASDALARSMTAKAFTTGSDVFLRGDMSANDPSLMAHELTHVVQQSSGAGGSGGLTVGAAGDASEVEADRMAESVLSGGSVARCEDEM